MNPTFQILYRGQNLGATAPMLGNVSMVDSVMQSSEHSPVVDKPSKPAVEAGFPKKTVEGAGGLPGFPKKAVEGAGGLPVAADVKRVGDAKPSVRVGVEVNVA